MEKNYKIIATITDIKGNCAACHKVGETFDINCHKTSNLCGFFYHSIFPNLQTFEYGGSLPWWKGDTIFLQCPDPMNQVSIKLEKKKI